MAIDMAKIEEWKRLAEIRIGERRANLTAAEAEGLRELREREREATDRALSGAGPRAAGWYDANAKLGREIALLLAAGKGPGRIGAAVGLSGAGILCEERRALKAALEEAIPALLAEREEMLLVLREVEWSRPGGADGCLSLCPACGGRKPWRTDRGAELDGHAPDCRLAALLR